MKGTLEFGALPILELDDGTVLSQNGAIERYIELKYSDMDQDPMLAY